MFHDHVAPGISYLGTTCRRFMSHRSGDGAQHVLKTHALVITPSVTEVVRIAWVPTMYHCTLSGY